MGDRCMKIHEKIALILLTAIICFGLLSYFFTPKDVEGLKDVRHELIEAIGMVLAFLFGVHVATPAPGTNSLVQTQTPPEPTETPKA